MSFHNFVMPTVFQGDRGERGPKGRDGVKVRVQLMKITDWI